MLNERKVSLPGPPPAGPSPCGQGGQGGQAAWAGRMGRAGGRGRWAYLGTWRSCCRAGSPAEARCTGCHRGRTRRSGSAPADPARTSRNTRSTGTTPRPRGHLRERGSVGGSGHRPSSQSRGNPPTLTPRDPLFRRQPSPATGITGQKGATELRNTDTDGHMPSTHATGCQAARPRRRGREAGPRYLSVPGTPQARLQTSATGFSPWAPLPAPHLEHGVAAGA